MIEQVLCRSLVERPLAARAEELRLPELLQLANQPVLRFSKILAETPAKSNAGIDTNAVGRLSSIEERNASNQVVAFTQYSYDQEGAGDLGYADRKWRRPRDGL